MKNVIGLFIILAVCEAPQFSIAQKGSVHISNSDIVRHYIGALTQADFETMKQLLDSEKLSYNPFYLDTIKYETGIQQWKMNASILTNVEYIILYETSQTFKEGLFKGEWVIIWGIFKAYHVPNKQWIEFLDHLVVKLENHKIVYIHEFYDPFEYLNKMGYKLRPIRPNETAERSGSAN